MIAGGLGFLHANPAPNAGTKRAVRSTRGAESVHHAIAELAGPGLISWLPVRTLRDPTTRPGTLAYQTRRRMDKREMT
jgi:hypothetical protein